MADLPQAGDFPGGKWEGQQSGAVAALTHKAWECPGPGCKWGEKEAGEKTDVSKEAQEFQQEWVKAISEFRAPFWFPMSVYRFHRSPLFKTYNKSFYGDGVAERRSEDASLRTLHDVLAVAVYMYTGAFYTKINKALRFPDCALSEKPKQCKDDQDEVSDLIRTLMTALNFLPAPKANSLETRYLWRDYKELMPVLKEDVNWQVPGFTFEDRGFFSTTTDKDVAVRGKGLQNVTKEQIKFVVKVDCQVSCGDMPCCQRYARDVHVLSKYLDEKEVIFLPGAPFEVKFYELGEPTYIIIAPLATPSWGYDITPDQH